MMVESTENTIHCYLSAIEDELKQALKPAYSQTNHGLYDMLTYHMGWQSNGDNNKSGGKRFRPLLTLMTCASAGGEWNKALPLAAAVELIHNFSLIHDDIEDNSAIRRGRMTMWKKWGIPQAINAGDAMFTLAHLHSIQLVNLMSPSMTVLATDILQNACLQLTQGQYLDLEFESRNDVTLDDYWSMVEGKTAALISASAQLGAVTANCNNQVLGVYREFGDFLGLAFQVQDDFLGIWGNSVLTGKSTQSDLLTRKKTLPVLFCLSKKGSFLTQWNKPVSSDNLAELIEILENEGAKEFTLSTGADLINKALLKLEQAQPDERSGNALRELVLSLSTRQD
jgi:geranylgeranyl diphosphate synthase type I